MEGTTVHEHQELVEGHHVQLSLIPEHQPVGLVPELREPVDGTNGVDRRGSLDGLDQTGLPHSGTTPDVQLLAVSGSAPPVKTDLVQVIDDRSVTVPRVELLPFQRCQLSLNHLLGYLGDTRFRPQMLIGPEFLIIADLVLDVGPPLNGRKVVVPPTVGYEVKPERVLIHSLHEEGHRTPLDLLLVENVLNVLEVGERSILLLPVLKYGLVERSVPREVTVLLTQEVQLGGQNLYPLLEDQEEIQVGVPIRVGLDRDRVVLDSLLGRLRRQEAVQELGLVGLPPVPDLGRELGYDPPEVRPINPAYPAYLFRFFRVHSSVFLPFFQAPF